MNNPALLNETDKYLLELSDFKEPLDRYVFTAIYNLYINGAEKIHTSDIVNYLQNSFTAKDLIEKENGISFLQDCEQQSDISNFNYYYNKLKKVNLVQELQLSKNKIDEIYCEDILNDRYSEINERFEKLNTTDIVNSLKLNIANIENKYVLNKLTEESKANDGIIELLKELEEKPEVGCRLQGDIFNTITRGGRRGKLYLRSGQSAAGKSRSAVGDAAYLAYPIRYDTLLRQWVVTGNCEKVLYVMTEQDTDEIKTMLLAYLTGINEENFLYGNLNAEEKERTKIAVDIMNRYSDNMLFARVADPCSSVVKNLFRRYNLQYGVHNFFFDYIFSSPAMLAEYRDLKIQENVALRLFTTTLKNLAVELNSFIMTSTQLSNLDDDKGEFKDFRNIQGSRSIPNLVDFACVISRPTTENLVQLSSFKKAYNFDPNLVIDVFKNRRGKWTSIRIWSRQDLGTCRRQDLFVTTPDMKECSDFQIIDFQVEPQEEFIELAEQYNKQKDEIYDGFSTQEKDCEEQLTSDNPFVDSVFDDFEEAFGDIEEKKMRLKNVDMSDLL